jgi:hypothetical protein
MFQPYKPANPFSTKRLFEASVQFIKRGHVVEVVTAMIARSRGPTTLETFIPASNARRFLGGHHRA